MNLITIIISKTCNEKSYREMLWGNFGPYHEEKVRLLMMEDMEFSFRARVSDRIL